MIKYDYEITVNGNQAKLNKDIYLFRGNKNVHYYFAVKNASFNFKGSTDLIEKTNAINAAVTVIKPNNVEVASAIAKVENGKIHLKVTEDLIDEEVEVGDFDLVFDLFDDTDGAVTIPKVIGQFHVLERPCTTPISELVATNTTNEVDQALTDYAIVTYAEPVASTNADGTFAKKTWVAKEKITTAELNRMEEGISDVSSQCKDITNKLEILPIKNIHHIIQNGAPVSQQNINIEGTDYEAYIFNDEQITTPSNLALENFENKFSAIASHSKGVLNAVILYNDGVNDITKEIELTRDENFESNYFSYSDYTESSILNIAFGFDYDINKFFIYVYYMAQPMKSPIFYEVKKVSLSYSYITNLLNDDYLKNIDYSKINNVPYKLDALIEGSVKTLETEEYISLFENLFIWDANKMNDKLDSTSGVKKNEYYNHNIQVKQKDSEGIGYGQYIPAESMSEYKLFIKAGPDVIVKVYQHKTKKLLNEIKDFSIGEYKEIMVRDSLNGSDGIFFAFTVKDDVTDFYANTYVDDLVLCKSDGFLTKQDVNNKVDKSQLSFNSNGELVVTIDGVSKIFVPKA